MGFTSQTFTQFEQPTTAKWNILNTNDDFFNASIITGWFDVSDETWTRTGDHTFTVPTDLTDRYGPGTKIRYKQGGGFEYGVVESSSFGAGVTTVTLIDNSDYAAAAASFTEQAISYEESPQNFPSSFEYEDTVTGFSADPTIRMHWKSLGGKTLFLFGYGTVLGTSNATNFLISIPSTASTEDGNSKRAGMFTSGTDNGSAVEVSITIDANDTSNMRLFPGLTGTPAWTNSGNKGIEIINIIYEFA